MNGTMCLNDYAILEEANKEIESSIVRTKLSNSKVYSVHYRQFIFQYFIAPSILRSLKKCDKDINLIVSNIQTTRLNLSYNDAKQKYQDAKEIISLLNKTIEKLNNENNIVLINLNKQLKNILSKMNEINNSLRETLFLSFDDQPKLTEKEIKSYNVLNELCGDDDDNQYSEQLHNYLLKQINV